MTNTHDLAEAPEQVLAIAQAIIQGPEFEATFRGLGEAFAEQLALAAQRGYQAALALRSPSDGPSNSGDDWTDELIERQRREDARQSMEITDEMVERAAKALYEDDDLWSASERPWPATDAEVYRRLARSALISALTPGKE